jgi:hypothetical protein
MSPAYFVLQTLALEVLVALLEHLTCQLQVAFDHLWFLLLVVFVFVLVLTLVSGQLDRLRLEHRICNPDFPVPACRGEPLVQRTCPGTLTLLNLEIDVCLPEELWHR